LGTSASPPAAPPESREGADGHRLGHIGRHQIDEHARALPLAYRRPRRRCDFALNQPEQALDLVGIGSVAGKARAPVSLQTRAELSIWRAASATRMPSRAKQPRQRCTQALAGADQ